MMITDYFRCHLGTLAGGALKFCKGEVLRDAYIMTSVHGTDLIESREDAANLLKRNEANIIIKPDVKEAF